MNAVVNIDQQQAVTSMTAMVFSPPHMEAMLRLADLMAEGKATVPAHLQNRPADCMAIIMKAMQWGMDPFAVAQKTHLVNGTLGYEAQLVSAVLTSSGAIKGRFHYEYEGEGNALKCRVAAIPAGEQDLVWGEWLGIAGITTKNSPLWKTNPPQQMGYLQVKNWARAYAPGAILGVYTLDELQDAPPPVERDMGVVEEVRRDTPAAASKTASAKEKLKGKGTAEPTITLRQVLDTIAVAATPEALRAAGELGAKLQAEPDRDAARKAYGERLQAAKGQHQAPQFDLDATLARIIEITSVEVLGLYLDDLRETAPAEHQDAIAEAGRKRIEELEG